MDNINDTKPLPELGNDAYKDVLASLSELDATGAIDIDYLEANKTRTFNFSAGRAMCPLCFFSDYETDRTFHIKRVCPQRDGRPQPY